MRKAMDARTMPFGKHKGERVDQLPSDYLRWLLEKEVIQDDDLEDYVVQVLERRGEDL